MRDVRIFWHVEPDNSALILVEEDSDLLSILHDKLRCVFGLHGEGALVEVGATVDSQVDNVTFFYAVLVQNAEVFSV